MGVGLRVRDQELQNNAGERDHTARQRKTVTGWAFRGARQEKGPRRCGLGKVAAGTMSKCGRGHQRRYQGQGPRTRQRRELQVFLHEGTKALAPLALCGVEELKELGCSNGAGVGSSRPYSRQGEARDRQATDVPERYNATATGCRRRRMHALCTPRSLGMAGRCWP
jgi:hypothetical protein